MAVGVFHQSVEVGDDEGLLAGIQGGEEVGYATDDDGEGEGGHTEADAVADGGAGGVQDGGADDDGQGGRVGAGAQAGGADAAGSPAEDDGAGVGGAGSGDAAAGFQGVEAGADIVLNDAPAVGGAEVGDGDGAGGGLDGEVTDEKGAGAVAAGAADDLEIDEGVRRLVQTGAIGVGIAAVGAEAGASGGEGEVAPELLPLVAADIAEGDVVVAAGGIAEAGGYADEAVLEAGGLGPHG